MSVSKEKGNFLQERDVSLLREEEALSRIADCGGNDHLLFLFLSEGETASNEESFHAFCRKERLFLEESNSDKIMPDFLFPSVLPTGSQHILRGSGKTFFSVRR